MGQNREAVPMRKGQKRAWAAIPSHALLPKADELTRAAEPNRRGGGRLAREGHDVQRRGIPRFRPTTGGGVGGPQAPCREIISWRGVLSADEEGSWAGAGGGRERRYERRRRRADSGIMMD